MIRREIFNKKTGDKVVMFEEEDFEYVNPVKHYGDSYKVKQMVLRGLPDEELFGEEKPSLESRQIATEIARDWQVMLKHFKSVELSENLVKLLDTNKKSEQEALLKGVVLTPDILMALLIKAEELGFALSQYKSEFSQKGLDHSKMPFAYHIKDDGSVKTFGKTDLSEGQLKQAIEHRKVKIAKFLDRGDIWHCFFLTYKSLRGEENWLGANQPHYHYISNAFGIKRADVIAQIKSGKYRLGNLPHIKLENYGKQPE